MTALRIDRWLIEMAPVKSVRKRVERDEDGRITLVEETVVG